MYTKRGKKLEHTVITEFNHISVIIVIIINTITIETTIMYGIKLPITTTAGKKIITDMA